MIVFVAVINNFEIVTFPTAKYRPGLSIKQHRLIMNNAWHYHLMSQREQKSFFVSLRLGPHVALPRWLAATTEYISWIWSHYAEGILLSITCIVEILSSESIPRAFVNQLKWLSHFKKRLDQLFILFRTPKRRHVNFRVIDLLKHQIRFEDFNVLRLLLSFENIFPWWYLFSPFFNESEILSHYLDIILIKGFTLLDQTL